MRITSPYCRATCCVKYGNIFGGIDQRCRGGGGKGNCRPETFVVRKKNLSKNEKMGLKTQFG